MEECQHTLLPVGQTVLNANGKVLVIVSILCTTCHQVFTNQTELEIKKSAITQAPSNLQL